MLVSMLSSALNLSTVMHVDVFVTFSEENEIKEVVPFHICSYMLKQVRGVC